MPHTSLWAAACLLLTLTTCTPTITSRWLTTDELGILPQSYTDAPARQQQRRGGGPCFQYDQYTVDTSRLEQYPTQYMRVNVHWMNSRDSTQNVPEAEAAAWTQNILHAMNYALANNKKMLLPPRNNTPVHPINIQYVLTGRPNDPNDDGVYYHYDDSLYYYVHINKKHANLFSRDVINKYGVQLDTVLNLFFMPHHPDSVASRTYSPGSVGVALHNAVKMATRWRPDFLKDKNSYWRYRGVINHEVGHILGLSHAWTSSDGCDDTPVHPNRCYGSDSGPGCDSLASNNLMDYNNLQLAWTPCQIARAHLRLSDPTSHQRKLLQPRWCDYDATQDLTIRDTQVWENMRDLRGHLTIAAGGHLTIRCRTSLPRGGIITIEPGGTLILDGGRLHQDCGGTWQGIQIMTEGQRSGLFERTPDAVVADVANG